MHTDATLLTLTQILSPAYPIGAFAFSHGIEQAIASGWISDEATLEDWMRDCLTEGTARNDAIFLRAAHGGEDAAPLDRVARAFAATAERLREADRQGAAFVATTNAVWDLDLPPTLLPVAVGRAAGALGLDPEATVLLYLQAFLSNLVTAAQRLMPLGQTGAQRVLARLQPDLLAVTEATRGATLDDLCGNAFLSDIAAMRHETLEPRLFQS